MALAANFREDNCIVCYNSTGFSTLCNTGNHGDHRVCLDCAVTIYLNSENYFLCPLCRTELNFQDYLVVRELHLIQSQSEGSMLAYAMIMGNNPLQGSVVEKFLLLGEESQIEMISQMYWGNDRLFDGVYDLLFDEGDDYPANIEQNKRIKKNLLEILGDPWSPELNEAEKIRKLTEVFTNGWLVKFCQNELKETFLHRCHLFLRANLPLHRDSNTYLLSRMKDAGMFFHEYIPKLDELVGDELRARFLDFPVVNRPAAGPLDVEEQKFGLRGQPLFSTVNWEVLGQVQILNNRDLEDNLAEVCAICHNNQGFPILCEGEYYTGEHKLCLDCVVDLYKSSIEQFCPICETQFNFHDYLVVRELHLIQSYSDNSVFNYFHRMMQVGGMPNSDARETFLWLNEKEQKEMLSKIYWGNDKLFDNEELFNEGAYDPAKVEKNQRIRDNLLEIFDDLWSPELGRKEKNRKLLEFFKNGWLVKSFQNESQETFLHRCHLFLRIFLEPTDINFRQNVVERMQSVAEFFPEYYGLQYRTTEMDKLSIERPVTGPLDVPSLSFDLLLDRYGLFIYLSELKKLLKSFCWFHVCMLSFPTVFTLSMFGGKCIMTTALRYSVVLAIGLTVSFVYLKYFVDGVERKIAVVYRVQKSIHTIAVVAMIGLSLSLFV